MFGRRHKDPSMSSYTLDTEEVGRLSRKRRKKTQMEILALKPAERQSRCTGSPAREVLALSPHAAH